MTSAILTPFRSSRAFVATVVPMRIQSMWAESRGSSGEIGVARYCRKKMRKKKMRK